VNWRIVFYPVEECTVIDVRRAIPDEGGLAVEGSR
jgi:hypothetical protein